MATCAAKTETRAAKRARTVYGQRTWLFSACASAVASKLPYACWQDSISVLPTPIQKGSS